MARYKLRFRMAPLCGLSCKIAGTMAAGAGFLCRRQTLSDSVTAAWAVYSEPMDEESLGMPPASRTHRFLDVVTDAKFSSAGGRRMNCRRVHCSGSLAAGGLHDRGGGMT